MVVACRRRRHVCMLAHVVVVVASQVVLLLLVVKLQGACQVHQHAHADVMPPAAGPPCARRLAAAWLALRVLGLLHAVAPPRLSPAAHVGAWHALHACV